MVTGKFKENVCYLLQPNLRGVIGEGKKGTPGEKGKSSLAEDQSGICSGNRGGGGAARSTDEGKSPTERQLRNTLKGDPNVRKVES